MDDDLFVLEIECVDTVFTAIQKSGEYKILDWVDIQDTGEKKEPDDKSVELDSKEKDDIISYLTSKGEDKAKTIELLDTTADRKELTDKIIEYYKTGEINKDITVS